MTDTTQRGRGPMGMLTALGGADPFAFFDAMHAQGPVIRTPFATLVVGYDVASAVLKDHEHFSSEFRAQMGPALDMMAGSRAELLQGRSMLSSDPPDHERLRGVVAKAFTPRSIAALEPRIREIAAELLEPVGAGERYDVIDGLAYPLPVIVIAELLGVPASDRGLFKRWSDDLVGFNDPSSGEHAMGRARDAAGALGEYFAGVIAERRRLARDDLVGRLVAANEGGTLDDAELIAQCILLLVAGNETTTHLIGNAVHALGRHPEQRERLAADPSLAGNTVEEVLRYEGVVMATIRVAGEDAVVDGEPVAPRSPVIVLVAAANRDPSRFDDPSTFDVARSNAAQNIGFGAGIHFCLGASLARMETRVALEALMQAQPRWRMADPAAPVDYTVFLRGPKRLELVAG